MLKRLIEVAMPLKEVSEQSAREKSIRHGNISTLHIWWARRPLAACRAIVFASLIPDPDDPECPEHYRQLVRVELGDNQFKPKDSNGSAIEDTPRNRCLEFIKHLVRWENSNEPTFIKPARKLIKEAHKIFHPDSDSDVPKVLDPFAGGGAIPLEALRLGCEAHAIDINPVAHLIELCTLVYPQKFGKPLPKDKPTPDYINELIAHNRAKGKDKSHATLFEKSSGVGEAEEEHLIPDVEISEAEYRRNPLAADVQYWGHWVLDHARKELEQFYPPDEDGSIPVAYLWARTVKCPSPACGATIPLVRQLWLCKKKNRKVSMRMIPNPETKSCDFEVVEGNQIHFDPDQGTVKSGTATCPFCKTVAESQYLKQNGTQKEQMVSVVRVRPGRNGKNYREVTSYDLNSFQEASNLLIEREQDESESKRYGVTEKTNPNDSNLVPGRGFNLPTWGSLYNNRQKLMLGTFTKIVSGCLRQVDLAADYKTAIQAYLSLMIGRLSDYGSAFVRWVSGEFLGAALGGENKLAMVWDYAEVNPFSGSTGSFSSSCGWILRVLENLNAPMTCGRVLRADARRMPLGDNSVSVVITDPPYYNSEDYAELSDYFYIWLKRCIGDILPDVFSTPLTPKAAEIIQHPTRHGSSKDSMRFYEKGMAEAFVDSSRCLDNLSLQVVMFSHTSTYAWEILLKALMNAGFLITSSWPIHTERPGRLKSIGKAALASSITIVCRKRPEDAGEGFWDDVRQELREVANERLDFFWNQGIRGADFFISAIGPALSVFGRYEKVVRLSGEEVTIGQFLDEVRSVVTEYALNKIIRQSGKGQSDSETRFYVVWKWSYDNAKVPADEAFTLAKALGLDTEMMWDRTGTLEKSGQNVQAMSIAKRMSIGNLGEPQADGTPGSVIDVLHRMCSYRDKGDTTTLTEFLARSGHGRNETLWLVAQAISEILPDGDKEKQLLQGLLNQRDGIMEAARDAKSLYE